MKKVYLNNGLVINIDQINSIASVVDAPKQYGHLVIPRSVQAYQKNYEIIKISKDAFISCDIESIQFPNDSKLSIIENEAFQNCSIRLISFPSSIEKLNNKIFSQSNNIDTIIFSDDSKLQSFFVQLGEISIEFIRIPASLKFIERNIFYNCKKLKTIEFCANSQLSEIDEYAFNNCSIECIQIPSNVTKIAEYAFINCKDLKFIGFQKDSKLSIIGKYAFTGCAFDSITIPSSVIEIQKGAFSFCSNLKTVNIMNDSKLKLIDEHAFAKTAIESFFIPSNVDTIKYKTLYNFVYLNDIKISPENKNFVILSNQVSLFKFDVSNENFETLLFVNRKAKEVKIPSYIKRINDQAFCNCVSLDNVSFDNNSQLKIIGFESFMYSSIKNIIIPSSVTEISDCSFKYCKNLTKVMFMKDSELKSIGNESFLRTSISSICIPSKVKIIKMRAFANNLKLVSVEFQDNSELDVIEKEAFSSTPITEMNIPSKVTLMKSEVFSSCKLLRTINFQDNSQLQEITYSLDYSGIKSISFPPSIQSACIHNCDLLEAVEFLGNDISLEYISFYKCFNISIVSFPNANNVTFEHLFIDYALLDHDVILFAKPKINIYQGTTKLYP